MKDLITDKIKEIYSISASDGSFNQIEKVRVDIFANIFTHYKLDSLDFTQLYRWNESFTEYVFNHRDRLKYSDDDKINGIFEILANAIPLKEPLS